MAGNYRYQPDYAAVPGWLVEDHLKARGLSQAELARRCGRSPKLISEIVSGKAPIEPETALQFERVLGVAASIWLGIEADYRLHLARAADAARVDQQVLWAKRFPIAELRKRGLLGPQSSDRQTAVDLLTLFGVSSVEAWSRQYNSARVSYRHSPSFKSDEAALATWLRLGEREAAEQPCTPYDSLRFRGALRKIRDLTTAPVELALQNTQRLCNDAGVALSVVKPLPKARASGAAWWMSPQKAVIEVSARHKTDDHLWFSFFHEAAHILLHGKRSVFVDDTQREAAGIEAEANAWARDALIPKRQWRHFITDGSFSYTRVSAFASTVGIAPGIVVGRLQYEERIPWSSLNALKVRLEWGDSQERGQ
ncbi:MAG: HigA family addiction module antitoxin [Bryobacterales bacterium]|nr:HigA family addiction module antitoxin [Bryobacterales bacterium]